MPVIEIKARNLQPGNTLVKAGRTPHKPITVTDVDLHMGVVRVYGFTEHNPEPRVMFRALAPNLALQVEIS